jgi:hypothetical protein
MKKEAKQKIVVLFILALFFLSSISFFATGIHGFFISNNQQTQEQNQITPLTSFVVDGEIDFNTEYEYLSRGYTTIKVYSDNHPAFLNSLPENTQTPYGQTQLIVQKIYSNETYAVVIGPFGESRIENITEEEVFSTLCESLAATPLECGLGQVPDGLPTNPMDNPPHLQTSGDTGI